MACLIARPVGRRTRCPTESLTTHKVRPTGHGIGHLTRRHIEFTWHIPWHGPFNGMKHGLYLEQPRDGLCHGRLNVPHGHSHEIFHHGLLSVSYTSPRAAP